MLHLFGKVNSLNTEVALLTPEKVIVELSTASLGTRVTAHLLDLFILILGEGILMWIVSLVAIATGEVSNAILLPIMVAIPFLYFILLEGLWRGQTVGKSALRLHVAMADGSPITFQAAIGRNLLRPADMLPMFYFLGMVSIILTNKSQRLGDLASNTIVISRISLDSRLTPAPHHIGTHQFEGLVGDLSNMTHQDYEVLKRLCDRYPELPQSLVEQMIEEFWVPIAKRCNVPDTRSVHPVLLAEAMVMKYGRLHGLL